MTSSIGHAETRETPSAQSKLKTTRAAEEVWVGTWRASTTFAARWEDAMRISREQFTFENQTIRTPIRISAGGSTFRLRFSNEEAPMGQPKRPTRIGSVVLALQGDAPEKFKAGTDVGVTFNGQSSVIIPPGGAIWSDPIPFTAPALADLSVSYFVEKNEQPPALHDLAVQTASTAPGNQTRSPTLTSNQNFGWRVLLSGVDVSGGSAKGTIVAIGDSITDGYASTPDQNHRWPDFLAKRLAASDTYKHLSVVNAGISANGVVHDFVGANLVSRFQRDVMSVNNLKYVIVLEGINDIGLFATSKDPLYATTSERLIQAYTQLAEAAHARKAKFFMGTLIPYLGAGYATPEGEKIRQEVNAWIRTAPIIDGVVDFDAALRDPADPTKLLAKYDCGDHLHPNDAGYEAMAAAVNLDLFR